MAGIPKYITPLSYIRGSGTQFITTEIYLRSSDVVKSKWRFEASAGNVYGCFTGSGEADNFCLYAGNQSTDGYIRYNGQLVRGFMATSGTVYELEQGPEGFFANGSKLSNFNSASFTCSAPMYIFMLPNSSSDKVTARCYGLTVYRGGQTIYNFIPAQNGLTNEVGMWESVNGVWYGNAGTGDFEAGDAVYAPNKLMMLKRRMSMMGASVISAPPVPPGPSYRDMPLTVEIISGEPTNIRFTDYFDEYSFEYRLNDGTWISTDNYHFDLEVNSGDILQLRGNGSAVYDEFLYTDNSVGVSVYGNIMSIFDGTNYAQLTTMPSLPAGKQIHIFWGNLGNNNTMSVENLILPATTLSASCYVELFKDCSSITIAPELPATTLERGCYNSMFYGCTNLAYIKCMATDISANNCVSNWLSGVSATGTFVKNPNMSSWPTGASGIPSGWTVVDA